MAMPNAPAKTGFISNSANKRLKNGNSKDPSPPVSPALMRAITSREKRLK